MSLLFAISLEKVIFDDEATPTLESAMRALILSLGINASYKLRQRLLECRLLWAKTSVIAVTE